MMMMMIRQLVRVGRVASVNVRAVILVQVVPGRVRITVQYVKTAARMNLIRQLIASVITLIRLTRDLAVRITLKILLRHLML
jgi:hypothetical protein